MAPVLAHLCKFESLKDGSVDLFDIACMHDALSVKADNESMAREIMEKSNG